MKEELLKALLQSCDNLEKKEIEVAINVHDLTDILNESECDLVYERISKTVARLTFLQCRIKQIKHIASVSLLRE